jgi:hypothetical protein
MHGSQDFVGPFIAFLVIGFLVFLAIRAFMLWYWKINAIVDRLDQILAALKKPSSNS